MNLGTRQLFIYWRLPSSELAEALVSMRQLQGKLSSSHKGLVCSLFARSDSADATLMESYAIESAISPSGIDVQLQREITDLGDDQSSAWRMGLRHVEVFDEVT